MLIRCPNCGKNISDKAKSCVHCGFILNEQSGLKDKTETINKNKKEFSELDNAERKELLLKFGEDEPIQHQVICFEKKRLIFNLISLGILVLFGIIMVIVLIGFGSRLDIFDGLIMLGVLLVIFIICVVTIVLGKINRHKNLIAYKCYDEWLQKRNIVGFADTVADNSEEREKLDNLDK